MPGTAVESGSNHLKKKRETNKFLQNEVRLFFFVVNIFFKIYSDGFYVNFVF